MEKIDRNYLSIQFWLRIYEKNATEFQSFFEDIMQKAFPDFQKIRPYGKQGDRGNDGYIPDKGIYYQAYAPEKPSEKEAAAAQKLKKDFNKLKAAWDQISKIKLFYFVFNDKGSGAGIEIERALAELRDANPGIEFKRFTAKNLEDIFFTLKPEQILSLGFDIDSTNALRIAHESLAKLEIYLDRENGEFVLKTLGNFKDILSILNDESLSVEYEILECRALQKSEKIKEARRKYEDLCKRYPKDQRAFLYLAQIYLNNEDFQKNAALLEQAEKIDNSFDLLALHKLIREYHLGNQIAVEKINEQSFPSDPRLKSNFFRLYSLFFERAGNREMADSFIERAIHLNPNSLNNYDAKLALFHGRLFSKKLDEEDFRKAAGNFLSEIDSVQHKVSPWGALTPRNQAFFSGLKIDVFFALENAQELERLLEETFDLTMRCYFDHFIDKLLFKILMFIELPPKDFERLLRYLKEAEKPISDDLAKTVVLQFNFKESLFTEGKKFYESIGKKNILDFINNLETKKFDEVWIFLKEDLQFAVAMANAAKQFPDLRKKIIENLPNDGSIQKEKLLLLLNYDEKNINEAFDLLKSFDLSNLRYFECKPLLEIAQEKKAWDFVIKVLEKLLQYEKNKRVVLQLKLQLFTASLNIERFPEAIKLGEGILANPDEASLLEGRNGEILLGQTIAARLKRGEHAEAKELLEKYQNYSNSFEFKVGAEAEVYIRNNDGQKALSAVVAGVKTLSTPTPEDYGNLFFYVTRIGNLFDIPLASQEKVDADCFVKLKDQERWYFVGDKEELDATKVPLRDEKSSLFLGKKVGEKVVFDDRYRSASIEHTIENILTIDKYVIWQSSHYAQQLSREHRWDTMEMIEVPTTGEVIKTIDTKYIVARLEDDRRKRADFFDLYCRENVPLAFLAVVEGGLTNAIGCIQNENRGFIKFSSGDLKEINQQKEIAKRIIAGEPFYIDGTSALVLSEPGLLEEIYAYLPNLKVPQSVITLLLDIKEKFRYIPGQVGHMGYAQGKLTVSLVDRDKGTTIQKNFEKSIKLLESRSQNISAISAANKADCFSEQKVPAALCDACVLAQKDATPVITEDFLYLKVNEIETGKKTPEYCSAFALTRVLYEQKKITFEQYLNFFTYLSSYRFRFLPFTTEDIEKAVFGDGAIMAVQPEKIRQFNFPLTLSEQYGVTFDTACRVVVLFLIKVLIDDAVLSEMAERIFVEILSTFPDEENKRTLGKMFLRVSVQIINKTRQKLIIGARVQEKIDRLSQLAEIYNSGTDLWKP